MHETVQRAPLGDLVGGHGEALGVAHVDDPRATGAADVLDGAFGVGETAGVDVERGDRGAGFREHATDRGADPTTTGACHHDRAPVEPEPFRDHAYIVTMRLVVAVWSGVTR